ncbi:hypothetical protein KXR53_35175 [Inquilinus limosus]
MAASLVVEDEWMIASTIEAIVIGAGYDVAGPAGRDVLEELVQLSTPSTG